MDQLNEIQQLYNRIPKQVIAKFTTRLTDYTIQVPQIDIPTEMDQTQCNKLIKQFLQSKFHLNQLNTLKFQFLVGGKLLRGQIKSHIIRYDISCEETLHIEYFLAFEQLDHQLIINQQDWISTLQIIPHPLGNLVVAALFNGQTTFHSTKNQEIFKNTLDQDAIKTLKLLPAQQENTYYIISGGLSEQIKVSSFLIQNHNKITLEPLSTTDVEATITAIDVNPLDDGHFCTVTNTGALFVHKIPANFASSDAPFNQLKKKKKKRHLNQKTIQFIAKQNIHKEAINTVNWITQDRIVTGSSDHSIKLIDVQRMTQIGTVLTKDSITTSIQYSNQRLLTSHQDGFIRLWDIRSPQTPTNTYKAHSRLVSSVKYHPNKSFIFSSVNFNVIQGSYDTTVKVWDCRSSFPLQNIGTHHDKIFCVAWKHESELVAGGADSKISVHSL